MNRKILTLTISLLILFALPTISLYYSYQGSQLRKKALAELTVKSTLPSALANQLNSDARYRIIISNFSDSVTLKLIINQFIEEKVDFVFVNDSVSILNFNEDQINKWNKKRPFLWIRQADFKLGENEMLLTNGNHEVLNTYDLRIAELRKKLVEDIAFLITKK